MKRFYKQTGVAAAPEGFSVTLDGRPVRTPGGGKLVVRGERMAEAIAAEWAAQGDEVVPASMPLTQLAATALDRVGPMRASMLDELMKYAATDLLCYRAEAPHDLVERQAAAWQPILDWAMLRLDTRLAVTSGVMPVEQPPEALAALRRAVEAYDDFRLAALQSIAAACGSLVLALAVAEGRLDAAAAHDASVLDEMYEVEQWGDDAEAAKRREALRADVQGAAAFLALCGE